LYKLPYTRANHKSAQELQTKIDDRLSQHNDGPIEIGFGKQKKGVTGGSDTEGAGEIYELPAEKRIPKPTS
jgi:hypothetical protein